jgi:hypothetical protein
VTFETVITLVLIGGMGYMMFKGGGCCGPGGHKKDDVEGTDEKQVGKHEKPEIGPGENKEENK